MARGSLLRVSRAEAGVSARHSLPGGSGDECASDPSGLWVDCGRSHLQGCGPEVPEAASVPGHVGRTHANPRTPERSGRPPGQAPPARGAAALQAAAATERVCRAVPWRPFHK